MYPPECHEHGLSIDADVALWMGSRTIQKKPPLQSIDGFVFLSSKLHDEFDAFKRNTQRGYSVFPLVTLLEQWNNQRASPSQAIHMYGRTYISLHCSEVDDLCDWVYHTRNVMGYVVTKGPLGYVNSSNTWHVAG